MNFTMQLDNTWFAIVADPYDICWGQLKPLVMIGLQNLMAEYSAYAHCDIDISIHRKTITY